MTLLKAKTVLAEAVRVLSELAIGQTIDTDVLRIHRYSNSIRVTDITNAGKRGKTAEEFSIYGLDGVRSPKMKRLIEQFANALPKTKSYQKALAMANGLVQEALRLKKEEGAEFGMVPGLETYKTRGVDIAPTGFKPIKINSTKVALRADNDSFRVTDLEDPYNEPTIIDPTRGTKTAVKKFLQWAQTNAKRIESMSFKDIVMELKKNNIDYHYYCAMD